jgi:hypothetical protein
VSIKAGELHTAEHRTAAEEVAVAWAVMRYARAHPAAVDDHLAFQAAEAEMLRAAEALGLDEPSLRALLLRHVQAQGLCLDEQRIG